MKLILNVFIVCMGLMLQPIVLHAADDNNADDFNYEESIQGNEDYMGYENDMPADSETSGSETEGESSDNYYDSETPAE